MDEQPNRLRETQRMCGWCDRHFEIERRPGRPKIYCNQSCRQRAYERRRGLGVLPPPDRIIMQAGGPTSHLIQRARGYEAGQTSVVGAPTHAMRSLIDQAAIEASRSERSEHPVRPAGEILYDLIERVAGIADVDLVARMATAAA